MSRYVLKTSKKSFIHLCAFLKHLRERKPAQNIWMKVTYLHPTNYYLFTS